jgi:hypothetical protein
MAYAPGKLDERKRRLDRAPGRSGRPLPNPFAFALTREDGAAFRAMVYERNTTINALCKQLALDELNRFSQIKSRFDAENTPDVVVALAGHGLQRERKSTTPPTLPPSPTPMREKDAPNRREAAKPSAGRDNPAHLR